MTYDEFKRTLRVAGVGVAEFASILQMPHRQSISNYSKVGFVPDHMAVIVRLMAALVAAGGDPRAVLGGMDMKRKRGRGAGFEAKSNTDQG